MTTRSARKPLITQVADWLDVVALGTWGLLLLSYWLTNKLGLLIHPNYFGLTIISGFVLLLISGFSGMKLLRGNAVPQLRHFTLLPPGWTSGLLLIAAILGLLFTPRPFASQTAIQRGLGDGLTVTRSRPQAFRSVTRPEQRSLIEWVRTLDVYPEPDAYTGQKVKVQGFVVHTTELPEQYFTLTRFILTCCAADAYPVGLPVKVTQGQNRYAQDQWLEVEGEMITETLQNKRQLTIAAKMLKPIPEPANPFSY